MNQTAPQDNPYAAPDAELAEQAAEGISLAGRWTRLGAVLLDTALFMIGYVPLLMAYMAQTPSMPVVLIASAYVLGLVIYNCLLLHRNGQSIGKRLLGIKVLRSDGSRITLPRILLFRFLPVTALSMIPFIGGVFSLVDSLLIFRDSRQCLHDQIADTIVVIA